MSSLNYKNKGCALLFQYFWRGLYITNEEVLDCDKSEDLEITLVRNSLRWVGDVAHLPVDRSVKMVLYGKLVDGSRKLGLPFLGYIILSRIFRNVVMHSTNGRIQ